MRIEKKMTVKSEPISRKCFSIPILENSLVFIISINRPVPIFEVSFPINATRKFWLTYFGFIF